MLHVKAFAIFRALSKQIEKAEHFLLSLLCNESRARDPGPLLLLHKTALQGHWEFHLAGKAAAEHGHRAVGLIPSAVVTSALHAAVGVVQPVVVARAFSSRGA